jgi:hypothetical protein
LEGRPQDCALVIRGEQFGQGKQFLAEYEAIRWPAAIANGHLAALANAEER